MQKEYTIQDRTLKLQILRSRPYEESFLPGRFIDMSMTFQRKDVLNVCPACQLEINQPIDIEIEWQVEA